MNYGVSYKIDINGSAASRELTSFLKTANTVIPKVNGKFDSMNKKIRKTIENVEKLQRELKELSKIKIDLNSKSAIRDIREIKRELDKIRNKRVRVTIDQRNQSGGRSTSSRPRGVSASRPTAMGRAFSPTSMMSAGGIPFATTIGAGLIGMGLRSVISEASQFQHTMVSVNAILRTTDKDAATFNQRFESMSSNMRQLGVDTKFSAVEIGNASRFLSMAGMGIAQIDGSMKAITNMAAIGDTDLGAMADVVTNIMTGYGIGHERINDASDSMTSITSRANVNIMEMGESMKYASNYMRMAGIDFSEGAAAVGVLGNAGMKGTLAGTALRAMIIRLIAPTKKAQKVIDRLGVSFTRMVPDGKGGMKEAVKPLHTIFSELKGAGASMEDLKLIFDKIGGGGAMALVNNLDKLKSLTTSASFAGGEADFLAEEKMKTVVGLSQQIRSKFLDLGQTLFDKLSPKLSQMMTDLLGWLKGDDASKMFDSTTEGISDLLDGLKKTAIFVKGNWHWLKYVLGGMAVKSIAGRVIGMGSSMVGGLRGTGSMLGSVGRFALGRSGAAAGAGIAGRGLGMLGGLSSAGGAAATSVGAMAASLTALVAGGAIVAGVGAIAYAVWDVHKASQAVQESRSAVADWSMKTVGANTESLDIIQQKLNGIYYTQNKISGEKKTTTKSFGQTKWDQSIKGWRKTNKWSWLPWASGDERNKDLTGTVKDLAISGKRGEQIRNIWKDAMTGGPGGINANIQRIMSLRGQYASMSQGKTPLSSMMETGIYGGGKGYNQVLQSRDAYQSLIGFADTMIDQLQSMSNALGFEGKGQNIHVLKSLDALLGGKMNLGGFIEDMKTGRYTTGEDIKNRLGVNKLSVSGIKTTLASMGIGSGMIDTIIQKSGLLPSVNTNIKGESDIKKLTNERGVDDLDGGIGGLSGTGRTGNKTGKMLIVNIDSLMNVENANFANEEDMDSMKEKMAQALMDVVKDFEIGY